MASKKKTKEEIPPVAKGSTNIVPVKQSALELAWQLLNTREWPISMIMDLAMVKASFHEAIDKGKSNEAQGSN